MTFRRVSGITVALALTASGALAQQQRTSVAKLFTFTDTSSVRLELTAPAAKALDGTPVSAEIVSAADKTVLWKGSIGPLSVAEGSGRAAGNVTGLKPKTWSPQSPSLYFVTVSAGSGSDRIQQTVRFGFRSVSSRDGRILINGRPVFLRGNAINPPERNIPDSLEENRRFVVPYVRYLKSIGVNIIRLTRHSQVWFDVCDELGMMLFQGNYGTPQGGKSTQAPAQPLSESVGWYKRDVIGPLVNHPSVVVYVLANEQADEEVPYLTSGAQAINRFLTAVYDSLHAWDNTRLYIANAGYGFGRAGDICDLHRYWGWYYNSFLSFYTMRDPKTCWRRNIVQPMTMTENTGNYTGVDGRFNLVPATKQPDSQLNWTGHAPDSEQPGRALSYQAWMAKQAIEIFRRTRQQNPNLAGLTPFTILFHNWWGIKSFDDMKPKPIAKQYAMSYQPILLSWELWTPNAYAGMRITPVAHLVNDSDDGSDLPGTLLRYSLTAPDGKIYITKDLTLPAVRYYDASSTTVRIDLPENLAGGLYTLAGSVLRGTDTISKNDVTIFVATRSFGLSQSPIGKKLVVYDNSERQSILALKRSGFSPIRVASLSGINPSDLLVLGANAWSDTLARNIPLLKSFIAKGGRLIILHQNPARFKGDWLPAPVRLQTAELDHSKIFPGGRPFRNGMAVNPERPSHPVFDGLTRERLFLWSDYTGWNESKPGFPNVYPVKSGFVITDGASLGNASILANYDHGLEGIALAELFNGKGSAMLTGFDLVSSSRIDPVAQRMLINIVRYMASGSPHYSAPLIESKIVWGDYASERGLLTGIYSGLILNTVPVVPADLVKTYPITVDSEGYTFAGGTSGWNTKPAIQYVPHGRRAFGPYTFSSGGSVELRDSTSKEGVGRVWMRVPSSRSIMRTTISNPMTRPLEMEIGVDGLTKRSSIPGGATTTVETSIRAAAAPMAISFRGDRRLVLLETDFR